MKREILTTLSPEEIKALIEKSKVKVEFSFEEDVALFGIPRWKVVLEGNREEIKKFIDALMKTRAGG